MRSLYLLLILLAAPAFAQDPSVEINMNILDVLEEEELGLEQLNERAVPNASVIDPEVTFSATDALSTQILVPPTPDRKPAYVNLVTQSQFQAVQLEERITKIDGVTQIDPPSKKQPPSGEDFGAIVAVNSIPIPKKRPSIMKAPSSFIEKARAGFNRPKANTTDLNIVETSAHEVLASIDPQALNVSNKPAAQNDNKDNTISLGYKPGVIEIPTTIQTELRTRTLKKISTLEDGRIEVSAYASAKNGSKIDARRTSLSRALKLRDFLIQNGITSEKIVIRALGNTAKTEPRDRADLRFIR